MLPTAETIAGYEKLGIVGILLLVLVIVLWASLKVGINIFGWVKEFGIKVLDQLNKQTMALENVKQSNASMEIGQTRLHARMDDVLRCPARPCPLRPSDNIPPPTRHPAPATQALHP